MNFRKMIKETFAKIIELDQAQVLVTKEINQEDVCFSVRITAIVNGLRLSETWDYESEGLRDSAFKHYSNTDAEAFVNYCTEIFCKMNDTNCSTLFTPVKTEYGTFIAPRFSHQ